MTTAAETTALAAKQYQNASQGRQTKPANESSTDRTELVSVTLWQRLGEIFGSGFYSLYGDVDSSGRQTWKRALADYNEDQIKRGLTNCRDWTGQFPPTLPEFARLCLTERIKYHEPVDLKRLQVLRASDEVRERELDRMRRILAGEEVETFEQSYHNCGLGKRWPGKAV